MNPLPATTAIPAPVWRGCFRVAAGLALVLLGVVPRAASAAEPVPPDIAVLADRFRCLQCHGLVRRQVGPGLAQIAERYRGDARAPAALALRIRDGGVGQWGRVIMPRQPGMRPDEAERLARWVLSQPAPPR